MKISVRKLEEQAAELLDNVVKTGEEVIVQRDGKDCAVIVSIRQWRRRTAGQRIDAHGATYRLSKEKQTRVERLLATQERRSLAATERRELKSLLRECDSILLRRAAALEPPL